MKMKMSGNPNATMSNARAVLAEARRKAKGQHRSLRARQAAEKVWLAASTAADALSKDRIGRSSQVFRIFERAWGSEGRQVAVDIEMALHRGCFYSDAEGCNGIEIDRYAGRLGRLLHKPIRDRELRRK